jgi:hypothetical protein
MAHSEMHPIRKLLHGIIGRDSGNLVGWQQKLKMVPLKQREWICFLIDFEKIGKQSADCT